VFALFLLLVSATFAHCSGFLLKDMFMNWKTAILQLRARGSSLEKLVVWPLFRNFGKPTSFVSPMIIVSTGMRRFVLSNMGSRATRTYGSIVTRSGIGKFQSKRFSLHWSVNDTESLSEKVTTRQRILVAAVAKNNS
jgi:hypothetical protein